MNKALRKFSEIVRKSRVYGDPISNSDGLLHPFDERNMHPIVENVSKRLFDDGHYSQATFEAYKRLDKQVQKLASSSRSGKSLMMEAFCETSPLVALTPCISVSERDEQEGYKFLFAGAVVAIRNPRGHENLIDSLDQCLDHLSLASLLLRRLDQIKHDYKWKIKV